MRGAGVASARVVWAGSEPAPGEARPPSTVLALGDPERPAAHVHLWRPDGEDRPVSASAATLAAWDALASGVADRDGARRLLDEVVSAHRGRVAREDRSRRKAMLEALAEFAAGAGHELNNPLAVIVGRGQLLLARTTDPETVRSLRAIITQAQRAHRILRDLMYVARPPEPRPRPCQPERDRPGLGPRHPGRGRGPGCPRPEFEAREARPSESGPTPTRSARWPTSWSATPSKRHPSGGLTVRLVSAGDARKLRWTIHDTGRGIGANEGAHLFDPFYCGRQAGRGSASASPGSRGSRRRRAASSSGSRSQARGRRSSSSDPGRGNSLPVTAEDKPGPTRVADRTPAESLGSRCLRIHRVGDLVAVAAEEGDVQGFVIIPVVPLQPTPTAAPGAAVGAFDHPELLAQGRRIAGRASPDPAGAEEIGADLQMTAKAGEIGVLTVPLNLFHDTLPV